MILNKKILFIPLMFAGILLGSAQNVEKHKTHRQSYAVQANANIEIVNKYGNIYVNLWDKDSVRIEADIKVTHSKEDRVDKILASIDFEMVSTPYYLIARTVFKNAQNFYLNSFSDATNIRLNGTNNVEVTYQVYVPSGVSLKMDNKFGNIYTTNHEGNVSVSLSNGEFRANKLSGKINKIELSFANATIDSLLNASIDANYTDVLEIRYADKLTLNSRYSDININHAKDLEVNSKRDKIEVGSVNSVKGTLTSTQMSLEHLKDQVFFNSKYSNLKIMEISMAFKYIQLNGSYTNINLFFTKEINCKIDITSKKANINYPISYTGLQKQIINAETNESKIIGNIGNVVADSPYISIHAEYGNISLADK